MLTFFRQPVVGGGQWWLVLVGGGRLLAVLQALALEASIDGGTGIKECCERKLGETSPKTH